MFLRSGIKLPLFFFCHRVPDVVHDFIRCLFRETHHFTLSCFEGCVSIRNAIEHVFFINVKFDAIHSCGSILCSVPDPVMATCEDFVSNIGLVFRLDLCFPA